MRNFSHRYGAFLHRNISRWLVTETVDLLPGSVLTSSEQKFKLRSSWKSFSSSYRLSSRRAGSTVFIALLEKKFYEKKTIFSPMLHHLQGHENHDHGTCFIGDQEIKKRDEENKERGKQRSKKKVKKEIQRALNRVKKT